MKSLTIIMSLFSFFSISSEAAVGMKPGLWEHRFTMKSESGKVEKALEEVKTQMANLPADQRKMMEEVLAQKGMSFDGKGNKIKVCISKEQAENLEFPQNQMESCKQEILEKTASSSKIKFICIKPESSGELEYHLKNPKSYTGLAKINATIDGKPELMDLSSIGKWLSASCGKIKSLPTQK